MYKCKHFSIQELVPPDVYEDAKKKSETWKLWYLFDTRTLITIDRIREFLGTGITINNWKWGGDFTDSGYRAPNSTVGSKYSSHRRCCACDLKFDSAEWTPEKLRKYMLEAGAFQSGFKDDSVNSPGTLRHTFEFVCSIEWIGTSFNSTKGIMSWFHLATAPDLLADENGLSDYIYIIGKKGKIIVRAHKDTYQ